MGRFELGADERTNRRKDAARRHRRNAAGRCATHSAAHTRIEHRQQNLTPHAARRNSSSTRGHTLETPTDPSVTATPPTIDTTRPYNRRRPHPPATADYGTNSKAPTCTTTAKKKSPVWSQPAPLEPKKKKQQRAETPTVATKEKHTSSRGRTDSHAVSHHRDASRPRQLNRSRARKRKDGRANKHSQSPPKAANRRKQIAHRRHQPALRCGPAAPAIHRSQKHHKRGTRLKEIIRNGRRQSPRLRLST